MSVLVLYTFLLINRGGDITCIWYNIFGLFCLLLINTMILFHTKVYFGDKLPVRLVNCLLKFSIRNKMADPKTILLSMQ